MTNELLVDNLDGTLEPSFDVDSLLDHGHFAVAQLLTELVEVIDVTAYPLKEFDLIVAEMLQVGFFFLDHCLQLLVLFEHLN